MPDMLVREYRKSRNRQSKTQQFRARTPYKLLDVFKSIYNSGHLIDGIGTISMVCIIIYLPFAHKHDIKNELKAAQEFHDTLQDFGTIPVCTECNGTDFSIVAPNNPPFEKYQRWPWRHHHISKGELSYLKLICRGCGSPYYTKTADDNRRMKAEKQ